MHVRTHKVLQFSVLSVFLFSTNYVSYVVLTYKENKENSVILFHNKGNMLLGSTLSISSCTFGTTGMKARKLPAFLGWGGLGGGLVRDSIPWYFGPSVQEILHFHLRMAGACLGLSHQVS